MLCETRKQTKYQGCRYYDFVIILNSHSKDAADKANKMLNINFNFKTKPVILSLYISLIRPDNAWSMWSSHHTSK